MIKAGLVSRQIKQYMEIGYTKIEAKEKIAEQINKELRKRGVRIYEGISWAFKDMNVKELLELREEVWHE